MALHLNKLESPPCFVPSLVAVAFKCCQCIFTILLLSPHCEWCGPSFATNWIPSTQGCFVPSLVKTGPVVLQKIFKCCQCIFTISLLSPHGEGHGLSFEQTWFSPTQGCFVPSLVKIGLVVLQKSKTWKVYRLTDGQTDKQQAIRKAHLSFRIGWAKNKQKIKKYRFPC